MSPARSRRRPLLSLAAAAAALSIAVVGPTASAAPSDPDPSPAADPKNSSFLLPVLPDTQFYSRYSASQFVPQYGTNPFEVQTRWIVEHQDELNIPFTVHVGDVVDQQWVAGEWDAAKKAMDILTAGGMPYSVLPGNHDVQDQGARSSAGNSSAYLARFGASTLQSQASATGARLLSTFQDGLSSAYLFQAEGHEWMSLAIAWNASDDTFDWAQGVLDAHPGVPVILSSHAVINIAEDQVSPASWWWGDLLWDRLIRSNDQIILTVNGHFHGATMRTRTNDAGHPVYQVLTDYQMAADGGNGVMTTFEFNLSQGRIDVETISPWVSVKDPGSRTSSDTPVLTGPWQSFSVDLDFASRFGWTISASEEDNDDLSQLAKQIVSQGWDGDTVGGDRAAAGNADDYIAVPGTIAHWRFGSVSAGVVDENTTIPDIAGGSPMHRNPLSATDEDDALEDVTITHENVPYFAADAGAVCFDNVHRNATGRDSLSYITTEWGAPATFANLTAERGYTIETFLQLDQDWTETANRWGAALTRGGARSWVGINDSADPGAGVAWIGISNLREYQYSAADTQSKNSYTLWSGEIMQGAWHHVAIVNDPAVGKVTMYVDGVPVLRNASNVGGMMAADFMPWVIGTSTWDTEPDHGWFGCVGETRVVDHALPTSQFLTARVDIATEFSLTTDLGRVYDPLATIGELAGTGHPGAHVRVERDGHRVGEADVADDGTWIVKLDQALAGSGSYPLRITTSFGSRDASPLDVVAVIGTQSSWTPAEGDLTPELEGAVVASPASVSAGASITITVPPGHIGENVYLFAFSTPTTLGSATVSSASTVMATIPSSLAPGSHRIAVYSAGGALLGWAGISVTAPSSSTPPTSSPVDGADGGSGTPAGSGTAGSAAGHGTRGLATTGSTAAPLVFLGALAALAVAVGAGVVRRQARRVR